MVACTQPLAANIGLDVLKAGGNAVDAAVAVAAAMNGVCTRRCLRLCVRACVCVAVPMPPGMCATFLLIRMHIRSRVDVHVFVYDSCPCALRDCRSLLLWLQ
jgi:hypothetical protein